ncbi:AbrB/MazE/SpoVT family DNA-binding domain-containing protein [Acidicapsa ligni]|uniref:AbrB/MazE/SpoVT family DNA-binding domain-containing protein n=1 Tax=Acidicapsa ligni TaxID=542300 RepID=UPI0021E0FA3D|nr:AbrB/MazE/SpoVT family DNA-binding domain-containing protein [Acidicapsa ligni]
MASATMTSKGQITIPIEVRTELGLKAGDRIEFARNEQGRVVLLPKNGSVQALKGMFGKFHHALSIEEMNEAIASSGAEHHKSDEETEAV